MEMLLQYCWKHQLVPDGLTTADGRRVEVLSPGVQNSGGGPDFLDARVRIGDVLWAGSVEVHTRRRDWFAHGHERDTAYDNVVLHVVRRFPGVALRDEGRPAVTSQGTVLPEVSLEVPPRVEANYKALLSEDRYPPCYRVVPALKPVAVHAWLAALQTERLQRKTEAIAERLRLTGGDWEHAFFVTLARSLGFGSNSEALELWATRLPLSAAAHHRDSLFQVEALFFGAAGLLNIANTRDRYQVETAADEHFRELSREWEYLRVKFRIADERPPQWRLLRMRPQNFPHIRIAQLARLYCERRVGLSQLVECDSEEALRRMLRCGVPEYWETHYIFGHESRRSAKRLSRASVTSLMINCLAPMLFAYGRETGREVLCQRAETLLDTLPPEGNSVTRLWGEVGLEARTAGESQALIQLRREYCDPRRCLSCRVGYEFMR